MSTNKADAEASGGGPGSLFEQDAATLAGDAREETAEAGADPAGTPRAGDAAAQADAAPREGAGTPAAKPAPSSAPAASSAQAAVAPTPAIRIQPDEDEPYDFKSCTVTINIQLLPDDGHEDGREVIVSVSSHIEGPLIEIMRLRELEPFAAPILAMLKQHEERLPALGDARALLREQERARSSSARSKTTVRTTSRPSSAAKSSSAAGKGGSPSGEQTTLFSLTTGRRPSDATAGAQAGGN